MSEQREIPQPPSALAWLATQKAKRGGHYSGGRIDGFREGWAVIGFGKAHHFELYEGLLLAACGKGWTMVNPAAAIFAAGTWPKCKVCERRKPDPLPSGSSSP